MMCRGTRSIIRVFRPARLMGFASYAHPTSHRYFGLGRRSARWVSLWSAATCRGMARIAAKCRRTPHLVGRTMTKADIFRLKWE